MGNINEYFNLSFINRKRLRDETNSKEPTSELKNNDSEKKCGDESTNDVPFQQLYKKYYELNKKVNVMDNENKKNKKKIEKLEEDNKAFRKGIEKLSQKVESIEEKYKELKEQIKMEPVTSEKVDMRERINQFREDYCLDKESVTDEKIENALRKHNMDDMKAFIEINPTKIKKK